MRVNVKMDNMALKQVSQKVKRALEKTAEALVTDIVQSQYIPFNTGNLQNVSTDIDKGSLNNGQITIFHRTPYARRLYYNPSYNFQRAFNSNAQAEWWEPYLSGVKKDFANDYFKFLLNREIGN